MVMKRYSPMKWPVLASGLIVSGVLVLPACAPTVRIQAPDKPIEINLNVKIDQEVRVRLDRDIEDLLTDNPDIF